MNIEYETTNRPMNLERSRQMKHASVIAVGIVKRIELRNYCHTIAAAFLVIYIRRKRVQ